MVLDTIHISMPLLRTILKRKTYPERVASVLTPLACLSPGSVHPLHPFHDYLVLLFAQRTESPPVRISYKHWFVAFGVANRC